MENASIATTPKLHSPFAKELEAIFAFLPDNPEVKQKALKAIALAEEIHEDLYQTRVRAENWINELNFARSALDKAEIDCSGKHGNFIHYGINRILADNSAKLPGLNNEDREYLISKFEEDVRANTIDSTTYYGGDTTPEAIARNDARQRACLEDIVRLKRIISALRGSAEAITESC